MFGCYPQFMNKLLALVFGFLLSCGSSSEQVTSNRAELEFDVLDKDANELIVQLSITYSLPLNQEKKIQKEYASYKDTFIAPIVKSTTRDLLLNYDAGEIYKYKRPEIRTLLDSLNRKSLGKFDILVDKLSLNSVVIPQDLMKELERKHLERLKDENKEDNKE